MPRTVAPLTDTEIRKSKKARLFDGGGLMLERVESGARLWRLRYRRPNGKVNRLGLGAYPQVTLAEARAQRERARALLRKGLDPAIALRDRRESQRKDAASTFEVVANDWLKEREAEAEAGAMSKSTLRKMQLEVGKYLSPDPDLRKRPVATLESGEANKALKKLASKRSLAVKARQYLTSIIAYAIKGKLRGEGMFLTLDKVSSNDQGDVFPAATEPREMRALLRAIDSYPTPVMRAALKFTMLTAVRPGNVAEAEWGEIDLKHGEWNIPASKMKMRTGHMVFLSDQAVAILRAMRAYTDGQQYVFPPLARKNNLHLHRDSMSSALRDMDFRGKHVTHGFRAMLRTAGNEQLRIQPHLLDLILAHKPQGAVRKAYQRGKYYAARRRAMQKWANYLDELKSADEPPN